MAWNFLPYEEPQLYLMPPNLSDGVAEGSLVRFVFEMVEQLEGEGKLASFNSLYRAGGWGRA